VVLLLSGPNSDGIARKSVPFSKRGVAKEGRRICTEAVLFILVLLQSDLKID
jgi:hypothetical protein